MSDKEMNIDIWKIVGVAAASIFTLLFAFAFCQNEEKKEEKKG